MTQAQYIAGRILVHQIPAPLRTAADTGHTPQGDSLLNPDAANKLKELIAAAIQTPQDLALIYRVAQISTPAPYFHSYFAWSGVSQYLQPMAGQSIRTVELQAALTEMAESMRVLADTASVNDTEAVPAIRLSLLLIEAVQMALPSKSTPTRFVGPHCNRHSYSTAEVPHQDYRYT